jgi:hypothetical protein
MGQSRKVHSASRNRRSITHIQLAAMKVRCLGWITV